MYKFITIPIYFRSLKTLIKISQIKKEYLPQIYKAEFIQSKNPNAKYRIFNNLNANNFSSSTPQRFELVITSTWFSSNECRRNW